MKHEISTYKTKMQFSAALKKCLEKKVLSKITISELAESCNLNRKTFYYHFEDLEQLLKWTLEQEAVEIFKEYGRMNNFTEAVRFSVDYIYKNKAFLAGIYKSTGNDQLAGFFRDDFYEVIIMAINMHEQKMNKKLSEDYKIFLSKFYANALAGHMIETLLYDNPEAYKTIAEYILFTISVSIEEIIKESDRGEK